MPTIRPYRQSDKEYVRRVCMHLKPGEPREMNPGRAASLMTFCDYYIECEPHNCFVAANDSDEAVGCIWCAEDWRGYFTRFRRKEISRIFPNHYPAVVCRSYHKHACAHYFTLLNFPPRRVFWESAHSSTPAVCILAAALGAAVCSAALAAPVRKPSASDFFSTDFSGTLSLYSPIIALFISHTPNHLSAQSCNGSRRQKS